MTTTINDPSSSGPMVIKWSEEWWAKASPNIRRCKAHRKNGDQCKHAAMNGGSICQTHGGRARQVVAKAKLRLMENADPAVKQLLKIAFDDNEPTEIRLKATLAAIDRAGLGAKTEIEVTAKPFEAILDSMDSGSRAYFRRNMGIEGSEEPRLALDANDDDSIVDVEGEVLDEVDDAAERIFNSRNDDDDGSEPFCAVDATQWADAPGPFGPDAPPPDQGMVPLADAVSQVAAQRKHATLRPIQRALPRGRT